MHFIIAIILIICFPFIGNGQSNKQVPKDLKAASVLVIKYNFQEWQLRHIDSSLEQRVTKRYGNELLYNNYLESINEAIQIFEKFNIKHTVTNDANLVDVKKFKYCLDYFQKIVVNDMSEIVRTEIVDKSIGGLFFYNIEEDVKYDPIVENNKYVRKIIKNAIKNSA